MAASVQRRTCVPVLTHTCSAMKNEVYIINGVKSVPEGLGIPGSQALARTHIYYIFNI